MAEGSEKKIPKFGSIRPITRGEGNRRLEQRRKNPSLDSIEEFDEKLQKTYLEKFTVLQKALNLNGKTIYYPFSGNDTSPAEAFPGNKVIYADIHPPSIRSLRAAGHEVHEESAETFNPGEVDALILLRPVASITTSLTHVKEGGYVICHDWKGSASDLQNNKDFELVALVHPDDKGSYVYDTSNLEDCWKEINDDEELRAYSRLGLGGQGAPTYWDVVKTVRLMTGKRENYIKEYKNLISRLRKEEVEGVTDFEGDEDGTNVMFFEYNGTFMVLKSRLPYKKGMEDDFYVFRKKQHEQT